MNPTSPFGWLSVLPPLLALTLAIRTRQVYVSLAFGIWLGLTILSGWNPLVGLIASVDALVEVFGDRDRTLTILLTAMIGALITFTQLSGGMAGFAEWVSHRGLVKTRRSAGLLAWLIGFAIFVEANIGVFVSGPVSRPIFDRLRISREKLSYLLVSTSSPKATIIPINSWGAYMIGLLAAQGLENPLRAMVTSIPLNFYALLTIGFALVVVVMDINLGPMKQAEHRVRHEGKLLRDGASPLVAGEVLMLEGKPGVPHRAINMLLPIATIIVTVLTILYVTGDGNIMNGSGALSAFWAVATGLAVGAGAYRLQGILNLQEITDTFMKGIGGMIPIVVLLMLAFVIGDVCRSMGTGVYVAQVAQAGLSPSLIPACLFVVSAVTSFATGTSWGTWAIMMPIGVPMVELLGLHPGLVIASILGGGLFGDHCSPISDSTIISSMAAGTDHIDHVRTQLPYAILTAAVTIALYLGLGFLLQVEG